MRKTKTHKLGQPRPHHGKLLSNIFHPKSDTSHLHKNGAQATANHLIHELRLWALPEVTETRQAE